MAVTPILFVIAHTDFQPIEFNNSQEEVKRAGYHVVVASDQSGEAVASDKKTRVKVDVVLSQVKVADYAGIFIIGGPGALEHLDGADTHRIIKEIAAKKKPFGAICISTRILAHAGVLKGKKATGWDGDKLLEGILKKAGALYQTQPVVIDETLITATGPDAAHEFGKAIVSLLRR